MLYFDLILMRMILAGLATVFLAAVYLLTRKWLANHVRSVILAVLLLLPLLAFVVMPAVSLPDSAPDWLLDIRLPDPAIQPMTGEAIGAYIDDLRDAKDTVGSELSAWLADKGYQPELNLSDWIILALPVARLIYLAGLLLSIVTGLFLAIRQLRRRREFRLSTKSSINNAAWQAEIAGLRDEIGVYKQADIVLASQDEGHPLAILQNWRQRTIPVPATDPEDVEPNERRELLIRQLRLNTRPRLLISVLWLTARCLIWFNPFFYQCNRFWTVDFQDRKSVV